MNKNVVGLKWVYTLKWRENNDLDKRKICTVAKDFTQILGENYNKIYIYICCKAKVSLVDLCNSYSTRPLLMAD